MSVNFSALTSLLEKELQVFVRHASVVASSQWKTLLEAFAHQIETYLRPFGLKMTSSWGIGRWTYFPWIRLYFPEMSTDPKNGIFIDYLFGWEDHEVLLTLLQGVDGKTSIHEIMRIKELVQSKVDCVSFAKSPFDPSPVANGTIAKHNRAESYVRGMIFHKKYTHRFLPDPSQLESDLKEIINIYNEVKKLNNKILHVNTAH